MKKVSIVIAAYNAERFLRETVESVLCQSYPEKELVIVDDGSTDGTRDVIAELARRTSLISIYQENRGIAGGRNSALKACTGDYIAMLDHDDLWGPDKLEKQVAYLRENGMDAVFSDFYVSDGEGGRDRVTSKKRPGTDVLDDLLRENVIYTSTLMFRRGVLEKSGLLDERFTYCEDWEWFLRMAMNARIGYLPLPLATRREQPTSFSNVVKGRFVYYIRMYEKHAPLLDDGQLKIFRKHIAKKCYIDASRLARSGLLGLGLRSFAEAVVKHKPFAFKFPSILKYWMIKAGR